MKKHYDYYWNKLDNVGTLYASTSNASNPNIYRLSVKLKEKVKKETLVEALNDTLFTIPSFRVKLRKGFFWYYLEGNNATPIVEEDQRFPGTIINNFDNNYFLFKVTYFEKKINIDVSHILTDGTGALYFLETLVTNYLRIRHPKKIARDIVAGTELVSKNEMSVDSFIKYAKMKKEDQQIFKERNKKSYPIKGIKVNKGGANVIIGTISVSQLKEITKARQVTITAYLTAILIEAIYKENFKYAKSKSPISICIPVNLRNYFESYSMGNFFSTILVSVDAAKHNYSFDDILDIVSSKMKEELNKSVLLDKFRYFASLQQNIIFRFIPLIIKDILLIGISNIVGDRGATTTVSNLGVVDVKEEVKEYIDRFDMISYTDGVLPIKVGLCSFGDKLSISFSSVLADTEIQRYFFTYLSNQGLDIKLSSSINEIDAEED
ncbi:MAG: hypothetical protein PHI22_04190 [Bacilli bacterium]|nr:hypothetical protein [Bacilli bacterium]